MKNRNKVVSNIGGVVLGLSMIGSLGQAAYAEGSRDLINSGGNRPHLEYSTNFNAGIQRRTTIKVYANVGETINLGSSAKDIGPNGAITYRNPSGASATCAAGPDGRITTLTEEQAGPTPAVGGYTPCVVTVPAGQDGIWEIDFVAPTFGSTTNPTPILATAAWPAQAAGNTFVTAWDVTVRSAGGVNQVGRVYANYLALNMGSNNLSFSSRISVLTFDGYQYLLDANGLDPFGFILFANNKGFKSIATTNPLYRSIQLLGPNPGTLPPPLTFQDPGAADNVGTRDYTHKMFFSPTGPDPTMPFSANSPTGSTWLFQTPVAPPTPSAFGFTGIEGTPNQSGTNPLGGNFQFTAPVAGPFAITIDINDDGIYGNSNDRAILGTAIAGVNTVFWDGKDGNGVNILPSALGYNAAVQLFAGEVHIPVIDPENNPNGIIIQRLRDFLGSPSASPNPFQVFYDDRLTYDGVTDDFSLCAAGETPATPSGCEGTPPIPRAAVNGTSSALGAHGWSANFGNRRGMDTWAYYPSGLVNIPGRLVVRSADLSVTKTDGRTTIPAGASTTYTIVVGNAGPSDSGIVSFSDTIPAIVTGVTWSSSASAGSSCGATPSGVGNVINETDISILTGGALTYTVNGVINPAATVGTVITNSGTVLRSNDVTDPDDPTRIGAGNNTGTDTTTITAAPIVSGYKSVALTTDVDASGTVTSNDRLTWRVSYANTGTVDVPNFQISDVLPSNVTLFGGAGNITVTVNPTQALTITPTANGSYTGAGNNNLFNSSFTLVTGGVVTVDIPVTINPALPNGTILSNQPTGSSPDLPAAGVLTDNIDNATAGLPTGVTAIPSSIIQTQNPTIDPTTVTVVGGTPNLLLVKRITAINGVPITGFTNDAVPASPDDDLRWPSPTSQYLRGAIACTATSGSDCNSIRGARPGDIVEFTIYFLSSGTDNLRNLRICDRIPTNTTFDPSTYASLQGILLGWDSQPVPTTLPDPTDSTPLALIKVVLTNISDLDKGQFIANPTALPATPCGAGVNVNGGVVVDVVSGLTPVVPIATGSGVPINSYGFVRFNVRVN